MPNPTVRASATALPAEPEEPKTLPDIIDDLDEAKELVEAASMAAADLSLEQRGPLRTLLSLVIRKLDDASVQIDEYQKRERADV